MSLWLSAWEQIWKTLSTVLSVNPWLQLSIGVMMPFQFVVDDITDLVQLVWIKRDAGHLGIYYRSTVRFCKKLLTIFLY